MIASKLIWVSMFLAIAACSTAKPECRREIVTLLSSIEDSAMHLNVHTTSAHDRASIGVLRARVTKTCVACHH